MNFILTNAIGLCICWVGMDMFDHIISSTHMRWDCVSSFTGFLISLFSFEGAMKCLTDSYNSMNHVIYPDVLFGPASKIPMWLCVVMHSYHIFTFDNVKKTEFARHVTFIVICGLSGMYYEWGALKNFLLFFSYGVPDLIFHSTSILSKNKSISHHKHLRINCKVNTIIRNIFMNMGFAIHFILFTQHSSHIPFFVHSCLSACILYMNSIFNEGYIGRYYESLNKQ